MPVYFSTPSVSRTTSLGVSLDFSLSSKPLFEDRERKKINIRLPDAHLGVHSTECYLLLIRCLNLGKSSILLKVSAFWLLNLCFAPAVSN